MRLSFVSLDELLASKDVAAIFSPSPVVRERVEKMYDKVRENSPEFVAYLITGPGLADIDALISTVERSEKMVYPLLGSWIAVVGVFLGFDYLMSPTPSRLTIDLATASVAYLPWLFFSAVAAYVVLVAFNFRKMRQLRVVYAFNAFMLEMIGGTEALSQYMSEDQGG